MPKLVSRPSNKKLRKSKSKTKTGTSNYDSTETLKVMEAALQATNYEVNCGAIYKDVNAYTHFPEMEKFFDEAIMRCVVLAFKHKVKYDVFETAIDPDIAEVLKNRFPRTHKPSDIDYEAFKLYFLFLPTETIKLTFNNTTQYGYMPASIQL